MLRQAWHEYQSSEGNANSREGAWGLASIPLLPQGNLVPCPTPLISCVCLSLFLSVSLSCLSTLQCSLPTAEKVMPKALLYSFPATCWGVRPHPFLHICSSTFWLSTNKHTYPGRTGYKQSPDLFFSYMYKMFCLSECDWVSRAPWKVGGL